MKMWKKEFRIEKEDESVCRFERKLLFLRDNARLLILRFLERTDTSRFLATALSFDENMARKTRRAKWRS